MKEITIFRTWEEPIADMAIDFLVSEGIAALKMCEMPRSVLPMTMDGIGEIEIRVPEDDVDRAVEIIAVRFSENNISGAAPEEELNPDTDDFEG
ncbi:hypothetical protein ACFL6P_01070 [Candidatus Latescibacterota bacterium]